MNKRENKKFTKTLIVYDLEQISSQLKDLSEEIKNYTNTLEISKESVTWGSNANKILDQSKQLSNFAKKLRIT